MNLQLEKAREVTDEANLRSAYAEVMNAALIENTTDANGVTHTGKKSGEYVWSKTVDATQINGSDWSGADTVTIGGVSVKPKASGNSWTVTYTQSTGKVSFGE